MTEPHQGHTAAPSHDPRSRQPATEARAGERDDDDDWPDASRPPHGSSDGQPAPNPAACMTAHLATLEACAGELDVDDWPDAARTRADAAREGDLAFVGRRAPRYDADTMSGIKDGGHGYEPHTAALHTWLGDCHDQDIADGYDPELGYGVEASRPPDFRDPEDDIAYPGGVIYEDEPGFYQTDEEEDYQADGDDSYHDAYYEPG